jgi:hypothetical protein
MTIRAIIILIIIVSTFSCNNKRTKLQRLNEIYKIVFATGGCYGECPLQVFSIDSSLTIKYHGIKYTKNKGFYIGTIDKSLFDTLNIKFENVNYKQLDSLYSGTVDDLSTELFIYYGDKIKHITSPLNDLPDTVQALYNWLLTTQKKFVLTKTNDSLTFETKIVNGPPPIMETIKFTPPTFDNH